MQLSGPEWIQKKKKKTLSDRCFDLDFNIFCAHVPVLSWEVATIPTMELPTIRAVIFISPTAENSAGTACQTLTTVPQWWELET